MSSMSNISSGGSRGDIPLVTVVSYCSNERAYIDAIVRNARMFSDLVVVSIGSRLYTGEPEDLMGEASRLAAEPEVSEGIYDCGVIVRTYDVPDALLGTPVALHNLARQAGVQAARDWCLAWGARDWWALLLDGDEVPDGPRVRAWWRGAAGAAVREAGGAETVVHKMANWWAFLHPRLVADVYEDSVVLAHSRVLLHPHVAALAHARERDGVYLAHAEAPALGIPCIDVRRATLGDDGTPMFCHFSWVRGDPDWVLDEAAEAAAEGEGEGQRSTRGARAALKAKVENWGHKHDRDWPALIDDAFDWIERGVWPTRDFVHGYPLTFCARGQTPARAFSCGLLPLPLPPCAERVEQD
jgi:hypothetical protein